MKVDYDMALEIASHEGLVREAYKDSVGVWTWSVGLTNGSGHNVERYIDNPQSYEHCISVFVWALERYAEDVREAFRGAPLTKEQFAAALSFHWNTGAIKRASWVKEWLAGRKGEAEEAIMNWSSPPEIVPRRRKERDLFFRGVWSNDGTVTEYTRVRPNGTPDWGSAKRVNLRAYLVEPKPGPRPEPPQTGPEKEVNWLGIGFALLCLAIIAAVVILML